MLSFFSTHLVEDRYFIRLVTCEAIAPAGLVKTLSADVDVDVAMTLSCTLKRGKVISVYSLSLSLDIRKENLRFSRVYIRKN